jgi:hypothetical protein
MSFRLFLIPVTPAHCWTFPTTTATTFMYHGCRKVNAVQERIKTRSVGPSLPIPIMPFYADTSLVRNYALRSASLSDSTSLWFASNTSVINSHVLDDTLSGSPLRIITNISSAPSTDQHEKSMEAGGAGAQNPPGSIFMTEPSLTLCESPVSVVRCDGWCMSDPNPHATAVSVICAWWNGR